MGEDAQGDVLRRALDGAEAAAGQPVRRALRTPRATARRALTRALACVGPRERPARLFTGDEIRVVLPELVGTRLYVDGFIEAEMTRVMLERLRPGMTMVDVGAQYGYHSVLAARLVGPRGHVLALEPSRRTAELLRRNVASLDSVRVENVAAGAASGTVRLHDFGPRHSALNSLLPVARVPERERRGLRMTSYEVPVVTLDSLLTRLELEPDLVKIDAESSELEVLRGMRDVLDRGRAMVTVETGDYGGAGQVPTRACIDHLTGLGYRCLEYADGALREHRPRSAYGYGNLYFVRG